MKGKINRMGSKIHFKGSNLLLAVLLVQAFAVVSVATKSSAHRRGDQSPLGDIGRSALALSRPAGDVVSEEERSASFVRTSLRVCDIGGAADCGVVSNAAADNEDTDSAALILGGASNLAIPLPRPELPEIARASGISKLIAKVGAGESPSSVLVRYGLPSQGAHEVADLLVRVGGVKNSLRSGESLELIRSSFTGEVLEVRRPMSNGAAVVARRMDSGSFVRDEPMYEPVTQERKVAGVVLSSLAGSAAQKDIPYEIVDDLVDLFSDRVEFRKDLKRGDSFSIVYQETRDAFGRVTSVGPIQAAAIRNQGQLRVAVRYVGKDGKARYFDEKGKTGEGGFLRYPLKFSRVSSVFSDARFHPVLQRWRPHNGVDFAAPVGTPVRTVGDGIVTSAGYNGAGGLTVKIKHSERYTTAYLHLSQIDRSVRPGTRISRGAQIGRVGATGRCTGPHLHFSLYDNGQYVDPFKAKPLFMVEQENVIPKDILVAHLRQLEEQHLAVALVPGSGARS